MHVDNIFEYKFKFLSYLYEILKEMKIALKFTGISKYFTHVTNNKL